MLTNKYAEGYPGKRYYGGCEYVDVAEQLAIDRAKQLFGADYANVQPHSGSQANAAVYLALLQAGRHHPRHEPGPRRPPHPRRQGQFLRQALQRRAVRRRRQRPDRLRRSASAWRPSTSRRCWSPVSPPIRRSSTGRALRAIADSVGAYFFVDMAHVAGLVAAGVYPNPVPHADVVTSTTHKTLRGPRGGIILAKANEDDREEAAVDGVPRHPGRPADARDRRQGGGVQGSAGAGVQGLPEAGGGERAGDGQGADRRAATRSSPAAPTNHLLLIDLIGRDVTGKDAEAALGSAHITVNKNAVPNDPRSPFVTSGLRIGTPAVTTRGYSEAECVALADWICDVLTDDGSPRARCEAQSSSPGVAACRTVRRQAVPRASRCTADPQTADMHCPFCQHEDTRVIDSRVSEDGSTIRRRRECENCDERFNTFETAELKLPTIVKSDGRREAFDERKLRTSFDRALQKRPVSAEQIDGAVRVGRARAAPDRRARTALAPGRRVRDGRTARSSTRSPTCASPRCTASSRTCRPSARKSSAWSATCRAWKACSCPCWKACRKRRKR